MDYDKVAKRIEKDKAMFVGNEIEGKTLGVIGLGAIGGMVVKAALALGMNVSVWAWARLGRWWLCGVWPGDHACSLAHHSP
jgi:phosphoglycerate dehydrogenase-like enzyme